MMILPFSPLACAVVTTMILALTFFVGRWWGIKWMINRIEEEMEECDPKE
jgi:hypothetical protein